MFKKKSKDANPNGSGTKTKGESKPLFSSKKTTVARTKKANRPLYKKKGNRFVAMDLGNYAIKFAVGNQQGNRIKVDKVFRATLPEHLYVDSTINDDRKLLDIIKSELSSNGVKDTDIIVSFESTSIIKRRLTVPALSDAETKDLIGFELEEYLGINPDDYIIQYKILSEYDREGKKRDIQIDAVPKAISKKLFSLLKQGGYNPCILGIQSNFIENMTNTLEINGNRPQSGNAIAVADIGNSGIVVNIFKDGKSEFNRIIRSTSSLRYALMSELRMDESTALSTVRSYFNKSLTAFAEPDSSDEKILSTMKSCINEWSTEIDRVLEYYRSRSVDNKISKLFIYGGEVMIPEMDRYIEGRIAVPTEIIRNISNLDVSKDINIIDLPIYVNPISALIRS
ncbi:MAG: pilus assembly protein PilM [Peptostreptococcaceae bacterium]|nr:pilus assembly protein PilM [Peptostreptococcaceae bacterium]